MVDRHTNEEGPFPHNKTVSDYFVIPWDFPYYYEIHLKG